MIFYKEYVITAIILNISTIILNIFPIFKINLFLFLINLIDLETLPIGMLCASRILFLLRFLSREEGFFYIVLTPLIILQFFALMQILIVSLLCWFLASIDLTTRYLFNNKINSPLFKYLDTKIKIKRKYINILHMVFFDFIFINGLCVILICTHMYIDLQ